MTQQICIFDFDGVLCRDRFYGTLRSDAPAAYQWIQDKIFADKELVRRWMRNEMASGIVNDLIAEKCGIGRDALERHFTESVKAMRLDDGLCAWICEARGKGTKTALVTDNMDVFSSITVGNLGLRNLFDVIVNSADHGFLKAERNGELFDIALDGLGAGIRDAVLIDDSAENIAVFRKKGGKAHLYTDLAKFKEAVL